MGKPAQRPPGRPPKPESERKRNNLTIRIRDETRTALQHSATRNGRSVSEEVEGLIEGALQSQSMLADALDLTFGRRAAGLSLLLARVMRTAANYAAVQEQATRGTVREPADILAGSPYVFAQAMQGILRALELVRPEGDVVEPKRATAGGNLGPALANDILLRIATSESSSEEFDPWAAQVRAKLGPAVMQRIADRLGGFAKDQDSEAQNRPE